MERYNCPVRFQVFPVHGADYPASPNCSWNFKWRRRPLLLRALPVLRRSIVGVVVGRVRRFVWVVIATAVICCVDLRLDHHE